LKKIPLTKGKYTVVDDEDFKWLSKFNWCLALTRGSGYAVRQIGTNQKSKHLSMHRAIMQPTEGMYVDHINRDTLDNRRANLRICTNKQNVINSKLRSDSTSGYRGVGWSKQKKKWQARIHNNGHLYHLGFFEKPEHAALVYDFAASEMFGEFAYLNFEGGVSHICSF
jgi:hypothetical protein